MGNISKIMSQVDLKEIERQLESSNSKDRLLALAALKDVPAEKAVPLIKKVLYDEMLPVRSMAIFALGVKKTEESLPILVSLLETDPDYGIRADAAGALGYLNDIRAFEPLARAFYEDTQWLVRFSAAVSLGNLGDIRAKNLLLEALRSEEPVLQQAAIAALGEIRAEDCLNDILEFVASPDWLMRQRLAESLSNFPHNEKAISALQFLARDSHPQVAETASYYLQLMKKSEA